MSREPIDAALQMLAVSGITIELAGDSITAKPTALVTAEVVEVIREHKPALVRLLRLAGGLAPDEATQKYLDSIVLADPSDFPAAQSARSAVDESTPCPHCGGPLTAVPTFDGYENFECLACDECAGCRKVVAR